MSPATEVRRSLLRESASLTDLDKAGATEQAGVLLNQAATLEGDSLTRLVISMRRKFQDVVTVWFFQTLLRLLFTNMYCFF